MSAAPKLREVEPAPAPFPSAARATLAAGIDAARQARRTEAEAQEALRRAKERVTASSAGLEAARRAIQTAKEALMTRAAASAISGSALESDRSLRDARAAEAEAQDNLDIARSALGSLEINVRNAELIAQKAGEKVADAARAVLAEDIPRMLAEAQAVQEDLVLRRVILRAMIHDLGVTGPDADTAKRFLNQRDLPGSWGDVEYRDWSAHPGTGPLKDYFARLLEDANADIHG